MRHRSSLRNVTILTLVEMEPTLKDKMMDNGVKINPLLRGLYGGSGKAK